MLKLRTIIYFDSIRSENEVIRGTLKQAGWWLPISLILILAIFCLALVNMGTAFWLAPGLLPLIPKTGTILCLILLFGGTFDTLKRKFSGVEIHFCKQYIFARHLRLHRPIKDEKIFKNGARIKLVFEEIYGIKKHLIFLDIQGENHWIRIQNFVNKEQALNLEQKLLHFSSLTKATEEETV